MSGITQKSLSDEINRISQEFDQFSQNFEELCEKFSKDFQCSIWILHENLSESLISKHSGFPIVSIHIQKAQRLDSLHFLLLYKEKEYKLIENKETPKPIRTLLHKISRFCLKNLGNDFCSEVISSFIPSITNISAVQLKKHLERQVFIASSQETEKNEVLLGVSSSKQPLGVNFPPNPSIQQSGESETIKTYNLPLNINSKLEDKKTDHVQSSDVHTPRNEKLIPNDESRSNNSTSFLFKELSLQSKEIPPSPVIPQVHPKHIPKSLHSNVQPPPLLKKYSAGKNESNRPTSSSPTRMKTNFLKSSEILDHQNKYPQIPMPEKNFPYFSQQISNLPVISSEQKLDVKGNQVNFNNFPPPPALRDEQQKNVIFVKTGIEILDGLPTAPGFDDKRSENLTGINVMRDGLIKDMRGQEVVGGFDGIRQKAQGELASNNSSNEQKEKIGPGLGFQGDGNAGKNVQGVMESRLVLGNPQKIQNIDISKLNPPPIPPILGQPHGNSVRKAPDLNINPGHLQVIQNYNKNLLSNAGTSKKSDPVQFYDKTSQNLKPNPFLSSNPPREKEPFQLKSCPNCQNAQSRITLTPKCKCKQCDDHLQLTIIEEKCYSCNFPVSPKSLEDLKKAVESFH
jgi:hypothetical protein